MSHISTNSFVLLLFFPQMTMMAENFPKFFSITSCLSYVALQISDICGDTEFLYFCFIVTIILFTFSKFNVVCDKIANLEFISI